MLGGALLVCARAAGVGGVDVWNSMCVAGADFEAQLQHAARGAVADVAEARHAMAAYATPGAGASGVAEAVAGADTRAVQAAVVPVFGRLRAQDPTEHALEVTDARGVVRMRGHRPERHGDDKSRQPLVAQALAGGAAHGVDVSPSSGEVTIEAVVPLRLDGRVVGSLKVGSYLRPETAKSIAESVGTEVALFSNGALRSVTTDALKGLALPADLGGALERGTAYRRLTVDGRGWGVVFAGLKDVEGRVAAVVASLRSSAPMVARRDRAPGAVRARARCPPDGVRRVPARAMLARWTRSPMRSPTRSPTRSTGPATRSPTPRTGASTCRTRRRGTCCAVRCTHAGRAPAWWWCAAVSAPRGASPTGPT